MNSKDQFPIFKTDPDLVYLDNAATTQKPQIVIDSLVEFYTKYNSNVHRGLYSLAEKATALYEGAREIVAEFIGAQSKEIIFTGGTTESINAIVSSLYNSNLIPQNPNIVLTESEHHSNFLPFQNLKESNLEFLKVDDNFQIDLSDLDSKVRGAHILTLTHISNVTGAIQPVKEIVRKAREINQNLIIILDAAQSVAHVKIDAKDLDVDFLVFSGHKMYSPTGVGVIYGKLQWLEKMEPFKYGGGMIREVYKENATWAPLPEKFEAGTPPIGEAIALAKAIGFINNIGFTEIEKLEKELRLYLLKKLESISGIKIYHPDSRIDAAAVVSFTVDGTHPHDLAQYLGDNNICIRAGHHCTQIFHRDILEIPASCRVSLAIYNSQSDIDKLIEKLEEAVRLYRK